MSYGLVFVLPGDKDLSHVRSYFRQRPRYELDGTQAIYDNNHTGCYFIVNFEERIGEHSYPVDAPHLVFNINFIRPRVFARESLIEIEAYLHSFPGAFFDERTGATGTFNPDEFLSAWIETNALATRDLIKPEDVGKGVIFAPARLVDQVWEWNYQLPRTQQLFGDEVFVPTVTWFWNASMRTAQPTVVWSDRIPIVIPELATHVLLLDPVTSAQTPSESESEHATYLMGEMRRDEIVREPYFQTVMVGATPCFLFALSEPEDVPPAVEALFEKAVHPRNQMLPSANGMAVFEDDLRGSI